VQVSTETSTRILIVHSDAVQAQSLAENLASAGYRAHVWNPVRDLSGIADTGHYPVMLVRLPLSAERVSPADSLEHVRYLRHASPSSQIVALVAPTVDLATCCQAVSLGVAGFVESGPEIPKDQLLARIRQAVQRYDLALREGREVHTRQIFDQTGFAGQSRVMADLLLRARKAACVSDAPVLICGESGTGKQLVAEAIHRLDPKRSSRPFQSVNCAAISGTLAESALFGHRRGAFTGATEERAGHFRAADGGTVLLDEIGDLPMELQPKLLRVLQAGRVLPLGSDSEVNVDVRVIAASNRSLEKLVQEGRFRLDLYQRINVIRLDLPALRHRPEDIPPLFRFFINKYASYYPRPIRSIDPRVFEVIARELGDGNVRELENLARHVLAFKSCGDEIDLNDLPPAMLKLADQRRRADAVEGEALSPALSEIALKILERGPIPLGTMLDECERLILERVLGEYRGSNTKLARLLGITRRTFYNKLRKYNLQPAYNRLRDSEKT
jgi:two-component system response regulator PilR (NtrC family)